MKTTEITQLIAQVANSMKSRIQPGVMLNQVPGASEYTISTDPEKLTQVLANLLTNACANTAKGSVSVGYEIFDDDIEFFIKDSGNGLSSEMKDSLSDLFETGNASTAGLGLRKSREIIEQLGGEMSVESRGEGRGSTFYFTIPNRRVETPASESVPTVQKPGSHAKTILIAEDNESNYLLFDSILSGEYNLIRARDGEEAVQLTARHHPDLILMDIQMPNLDGYGAVQQIRATDATTPIIAVTAYAFNTERHRILAAGFSDYMAKPINIARLKTKITTYLTPTKQ